MHETGTRSSSQLCLKGLTQSKGHWARHTFCPGSAKPHLNLDLPLKHNWLTRFSHQATPFNIQTDVEEC